MPNIKLESSDGSVFEVDEEIVKCSGTIKTMLEEHAMNNDGEEKIVRLPEVNAAILKMVIEWATYHKDDPPSAEDDVGSATSINIAPWDANFLKLEQGLLFQLIGAADYLAIRDLVHVACKAFINIIKNKRAGQMGQNTQNDLTAAEKEVQEKK